MKASELAKLKNTEVGTRIEGEQFSYEKLSADAWRIEGKDGLYRGRLMHLPPYNNTSEWHSWSDTTISKQSHLELAAVLDALNKETG